MRPPRDRHPAQTANLALGILTAIIGFLVKLVLTIVLLTEFLPGSFAEWQRGSKSRLGLVGFFIFVLAWVGAYIGYRLGN
jgi:hypothetical protein